MIPTRKVGAGALAAAVSILVVMVLRRYGVTLSVEESQAVTMVLSFATSYLVPDAPAEG
jgi:hypothetical protein